MHAGREGEVGRIVKRAFLQARLQFSAGEFMRDISLQGDFTESERLVGACDREAAILELDVFFRRFERVGCDLLALGNNLIKRLRDLEGA